MLNIRTVEPVYSDTPRDQGNVSDFIGCWKKGAHVKALKTTKS